MSKYFLLLVAIAAAALCLRASDTWTIPDPIQERPDWLKEGIVMAGSWEPLTFIRRRGGNPVEDEEDWMPERSEAAALKLKEAGINLVVLNLHKGFGLKAEAEDIDATRRFTQYAHKYGIRVGGYVGATMMYETFFLEQPVAKNWLQLDADGRPTYYNASQTFRYVACRNNPGYDAFIKKVLRLGVEDLKLDLIHFDQMEGWEEPRSCHCQWCRDLFIQYLRSLYPAENRRTLRFGFSMLDGIIPPAITVIEPNSSAPWELTDPLTQDWARFRCAFYARRYGEYDRYVQAMNPQVALEGNPNLLLASNEGFSRGVDIQELLRHGDIVWSENPNYARYTPDGRLISKIREFKAARIMGKTLFMYTGGRYGANNEESPPELQLAEAMAYNGLNLGMVGDVSPQGVSLTPAAQRYINFFHAHRKELADTTSVADVAVLRSFASVEFNPAEVLPSTILFEQTLIQSKIPFDIIFDSHLNSLGKYKVLVLANQDALSDEQCTLIRRFVENGGGLVATGNSSLLTDWRLRRRGFALADLFGIARPPVQPRLPIRREYGKGRVVYIPRVEPATALPNPALNYQFPNQYWKLPVNSADLVTSVRWCAHDQLSAKVSAPLSVTAELTRQRGTDTLLLHLVNYDFTKPTGSVEASVRIPEGFRLKEVTCESPDVAQRAVIEAAVREGTASFKIPGLKIYDLLLLKLEKAGGKQAQ
jgi:hypothetical protein